MAVKVGRRGYGSVRFLGIALIAVVGCGMVAAATPANADPLASVSAIVNRPPVDSLLSLCVTSQSLDPGGTCLKIGSSSPGVPASPATSSGTATMSSSIRWGGESFTFDGQITIGGQTFTGTASGSTGVGVSCAYSCNTTVGPFALSGTSGSGSLSATCWGPVAAQSVGTDGAVFGGGGYSKLSCDGSANGGPTGRVTLLSVYKADTTTFAFPGVDYSGVFVGN